MKHQKYKQYNINIEVDNDHFEEINVMARDKNMALIKIKREAKKRGIILNNKYWKTTKECIYEVSL